MSDFSTYGQVQAYYKQYEEKTIVEEKKDAIEDCTRSVEEARRGLETAFARNNSDDGSRVQFGAENENTRENRTGSGVLHNVSVHAACSMEPETDGASESEAASPL